MTSSLAFDEVKEQTLESKDFDSIKSRPNLSISHAALERPSVSQVVKVKGSITISF